MPWFGFKNWTQGLGQGSENLLNRTFELKNENDQKKIGEITQIQSP